MRLHHVVPLTGAVLVLLFGTACASRITGGPAGGASASASGSASDEGPHVGHDHAGHDHAGHEHGAELGDENAGLGGAGRSWPGTHLHPEGAEGGHGLHAHDHAPRRLLRTDLRRGWCEPAEHIHASGCGTPYVHGFGTEPAFLGRDLFVDVTRAGNETEVEAEVEWSLTRRLGLVAELPFIDAEETGFGDAGLGLRALLVEERRFLLSASTEIEIPTGSERRGLGSGNVGLGANLHTWTDLGSWLTLQTQVGVEYVPDERESELGWSVTLAKSFPACPLIRTCSDGHADHGPTVFSLLAEIQGSTALSSDGGATEGRWLLGVSCPLTRSLDLRCAFSRSFGGEEDEEAWTLGFILHL